MWLMNNLSWKKVGLLVLGSTEKQKFGYWQENRPGSIIGLTVLLFTYGMGWNEFYRFFFKYIYTYIYLNVHLALKFIFLPFKVSLWSLFSFALIILPSPRLCLKPTIETFVCYYLFFIFNCWNFLPQRCGPGESCPETKRETNGESLSE